MTIAPADFVIELGDPEQLPVNRQVVLLDALQAKLELLGKLQKSCRVKQPIVRVPYCTILYH